MALFLALGVVTVITLAVLLVPLLRPRAASDDRAAYDAAVYRDQLRELDRDRERGAITDPEHQAARAEIARRLLAASAKGGGASLSPARSAPLVALGIGLAVPLVAGGLYLALGDPELAGGAPRRAAETQAAASAGPEAAAQQSPDVAAMVARLAARLERQPDDLEGWVMLARSYAVLERFDAASQAIERAIALAGPDPDLIGLRGEYRTFAADGVVTPKAVADFSAVLEARPGDPAARYYLGLADIQAGRGEAGLEAWLALARDAPPGAPWIEMLSARIRALADQLGVDVEDDLAALAERPAGPSAEDVAAAAEMSAEDRQAMIATMVQRLADRLASAPDDPEGWLRLAQAYRVLGDPAKADEALAGAEGAIARLAPDDPRRRPLADRLAALRGDD